MASRFKQMTLAEFVAVLGQFTFTRRINAVHMHHTWRPNRKQYAGRASIEAMWQFHTQHNGWSDIAQHITIAPDGTIWTGRNWNLAPASSSGHNGNSVAGPFMFEMIGDFDQGRDPFDGAQRHTALQVVARVQHHFGLPDNSLHFHNQMSTKTCPGSSISYAATVQEVRKIKATLGARDAAEPGSVTPERVAELLQAQRYTPVASRARGAETEALAEPAEEGMSRQQMLAVTQATKSNGKTRELAAGTARGAGSLTAAQRRLVQAHVVNLDQGRFSTDGDIATSAADVDVLFATHLEKALQEAKAAGRPLNLLLYAHGGLVSEKTGLESALRYIPWWKANHIYPLYFVWETGLAGTLGALIRGSRARQLSRGITDLSDRLIERAVGPLAGQLWKNMKDSAEWASEADGGGHYVASKLRDFCAAHSAELAAGTLRLHAVGHSAGSIFHSHFLPTALRLGVPAFQSLHLLAPAIRVDAFKQRLAGLVGNGVEQLTLFTMEDELELKDTCSLLYRKSLLYLVHRALETEHDTPILGLEISLRADAEVSRLLGLSGNRAARPTEVVWASTTEATGRSSSTSTSHGGFDDDAATMESVARRVLGRHDIEAFPRTRELTDLWHEPVELPEEVVMLAQLQAEATPKPTRKAPAFPVPVAAAPAPNGHPRQRALCIGIDSYVAAPLLGCVADAKAWAGALKKRGFATELLLDAQATRQNILDGISQMLRASRAGDVLVIQYSGHGTQLDDIKNDDEDDQKDEALCPYDYASGAFVLDDDLRHVFRQVPAGVSVTFFADCCHSGSIARLFGAPPVAGPADQRARFMSPRTGGLDFNALHRAFRATLPAERTRPADGSRAAMKVVNFSACLPEEVAYESNGSGAFTVRALRLLDKLSASGVSHHQFQDQLRQAFRRHTPAQHPTLDCPPTAETLLLLQALAATSTKPKGKPRATATAK